MDDHIEAFQEAIKSMLSSVDLETAQLFLECFREKLNEQKRTEKDIKSS
jgi:hypothetical protein